MTIRTVFFDVGNTLLTPAIPEGEVLVKVAADLGVTIDPALVEQNIPRMWERYEELYEADNAIWADEDRAVGIWLTMYEYLCELVGVEKDLRPRIARLGYEFFLEPDSWALFDDVISTLFALRSRGIMLGLISNWDSSLNAVINGMGIGFYFGVIISSAVVGLHKPQPEIFQLALREANALVPETLYVGDHLHADVEGAAGVGITPVLIDRDDRHPDSKGYIRIRSLRELMEHL
ncbi:MAG: HAD-IA family hydrolase [Coriobacteriales bacterium]|jgi:putative hydrolase of the HAD superfamily|nr:HAD-IA family hydrolase [Coriobacteriales bacterium]